MELESTTSTKESRRQQTPAPKALIPIGFFLIEVFAYFYLGRGGEGQSLARFWPLVFGLLWAGMLSAVIFALPRAAARVVFGIGYYAGVIYAGVQTGYYLLFSEMMWLSDFRYASEGADYADVLLSYPAGWWLALAGLLILGILLLVWFPKGQFRWLSSLGAAALAVLFGVGAWLLPEAVFYADGNIRYAGSDYGRMQSSEAAYENMFNAHRLYQVCGLYQTFAKDLSTNVIYPLTPGYAREREAAYGEIEAALSQQPAPVENPMTGTIAGKNVVLVLMESMDDWMIGEHTPTLSRLMEEGIDFTRFYTPVYGGIRTFNTEFAINTGSFLSSAGGYAFDYVTNDFSQSLANQLRQAGYSAKTFHYNDPNFYSRGVFSEAMGYEDYVCYADYVPDDKAGKQQLYDDCLLFDNPELNQEFFRQGKPTLNFIITRSAHLSYKYNEVLSHWGLKKYPEYRGLTGNEETDCAYLKARLVDDMFARLLEELESHGQLENTVIIGITDHYTYGYKDESSLLALSGVTEKLLLEKTPAFIWGKGLEPRKVDKLLNTADFLPTVLNLLGIDSQYDYIGSDAFDPDYQGFVPFSNGSWMARDVAFDASTGKYIPLTDQAESLPEDFRKAMDAQVRQFIKINNAILKTDYYGSEAAITP